MGSLRALLVASGLWSIVAAAVTQPSYGAQYFVAPDGNNAAAGDANAPWQTLQFAADSVGPGDRVTVRAGQYTGFYLTTSGTAAAPIAFLAEPGVLINEPNSVTPDGINLELVSHVVVDGFAVSGVPRAGVRAVGLANQPASFVTIRNVTASNNGRWGIFTGHVDDLLIESNRTSGSVAEHGIYVSNSGDRPIVRNNIAWSNNGSGIQLNADESQGGDGIITQAVISGNVIYDNGRGGGSGINLDGVQNSLIVNNLLYQNHASGVSLFQIDGGGPSTGNRLINNTIHQADDGRWAVNLQDGAADTTVLNNILVSDHSFRGAIDASGDSLLGLDSDYNVVIPRFTSDDQSLTLAEWQSLTGGDAHSIDASVAELFVDASTGNYHLQPDAPAIDMGTANMAPGVDLDGLPRPQGLGFDVGAFEFGGLPGDFNGNSTIDAADYTAWRDALTAGNSSLTNDPTPGTVDESDFLYWRDHFGEVLGSGAGAGTLTAVPEPAMCQIVALGFVTSCILRRRFLDFAKTGV